MKASISASITYWETTKKYRNTACSKKKKKKDYQMTIVLVARERVCEETRNEGVNRINAAGFSNTADDSGDGNGMMTRSLRFDFR